MSVKLPRLDETIEFIEQAEQLADGKRQTKYMAGVVQEFANFVNAAEELEREATVLLQLKNFVERKQKSVAALAVENISEHYEGEYDAYENVLKFLRGEVVT